MSFKYFAYGSNMLSERMHVNCPSAVKKCTAVLKDYCLAFTGFGNAWNGSVATIVKKPGSEVWGVVWEIGKEHEDALERQEYTHNPIMVTVETSENEEMICKCFEKHVPPTEQDAKPSAVYKTVIINGAIEHGLPKQYVEFIQRFADNGYKGPIDVPIKNPLH